ncbi:meiosis-specific protein MEI4-like [Ruditapes philippinarum]|uniref:meiosis-specific protein MEI4-like n=1 Tax=Ruditapes philippinarum TaxID=129788 RepID=UPI00295A995D|nr:meiosis-specific protein MEI4-like [Ruditapes philippinarum]
MEKYQGIDDVPQAMKVAIAIGIIKNKPPDISGRRYAEILCEKFRTSQLHWKKQYERAGTEILHLKQQLMMTTQMQPSAERANEQNSQMLDDSLPSTSQSLFPTPPLSGNAELLQGTSSGTLADAEFSLAKHTEFLHHVINIQSASKILESDKSMQNVTQQSLKHSLVILQTHIGDSKISWTVQEQCVQTVNTIVDKKNISETVLKEVCSLYSHLIEEIMSYANQDYKVQKRKCDLLYTFSDCRKLIPKFLQLLSGAILSYSSTLRKCVQEKEFPDSSKFCSSYYIIKAAEKCICKSERQLTSEDKLVIRTKLENSLLHITDHYPLFAHAIWRLCSLLT